MGNLVVIDIETKNFFTDEGVGWNNFNAIEVSVVGLYEYRNGTFSCFNETELAHAARILEESGGIVGFSINRYDIPVLARHMPFDLWGKRRFDLLEEIELQMGYRISLDRLAHANLGVAKIGHGAEAITLFREGRIEELKTYCLHDVKLTKDLFDLAQSQHFLLVPSREAEEPVRCEMRPFV